MRFIELLVALTAVVVVVNAAPVVEKREVVNADTPFDTKAFNFDPKMNKRGAGKSRRRHHKRSGAKACCGEVDIDFKTDFRLKGGSGHIQPPPGFTPLALAVPPPVPAHVPAPVSAPPPSVNNQDTVVINIDNKINH
ncbi:hypothetical protein INT47_000781 [Mucor saturninus]|uniref:Uncharacterized protein n=1 Tax=Mucor saturninus TaxID=64648 RepID=A0A8H7QH02_9FUNG|nr:hypothetical protein INT47_000781 [Mucor saturninus]